MSTTQGGKHIGKQFGHGSNYTPRPYTIELQRGQCYLVKSSREYEYYTISSSTVIADKPIFVLAGHENAYLGGGSPSFSDERDFMIESMVPTEAWDSRGYITAPLISSPNGGLSQGETYSPFVIDSKQSSIVEMRGADGSKREMEVGLLFEPPPIFNESSDAVWYSSNSVPFSLMCYDQRQGSNKYPSPAPSMMSIVPVSQWRKSYMWFVPDIPHKATHYQFHYINVFGAKGENGKKLEEGILISRNGETYRTLQQAAEKVAEYNIANYPDMKCVTYKLTPGSYYARSLSPFIIYNYGFRTFSINGSYIPSHYSYNIGFASPTGMNLRNPKDTSDVSFVIDSSDCLSYRICVRSSSPEFGIKSVRLLDDVRGVMFPTPDSLRQQGVDGYKSSNTRLDPTLDPEETGLIMFTGEDTSVCFSVPLKNISEDGYAPIVVTTVGGSMKLFELHYEAYTGISFEPDLSKGLHYGYTQPGVGTIATVIVANDTDHDIVISGGRFTAGEDIFKLVGVMPLMISPSAKGAVQIYLMSPDTVLHRDTLVLSIDCFKIHIPLSIQNGVPNIKARDLNFGTIGLGGTRTLETIIENTASVPITLIGVYFVSDSVNYSIEPSTYGVLPKEIQAGGKFQARISYTPNDTGNTEAFIVWEANAPPPFNNTITDTSRVGGRSVSPSIRWSKDIEEFRADSVKEFSRRVYLINEGSSMQIIDNVFITGTDIDEYRITDFKLGLPRLMEGFALDLKDSVWFDVTFKLNLTKAPFFRHRTASLIASYRNYEDSTNYRELKLEADFDMASVKVQPVNQMQLMPNPVHGDMMTVRFSEPLATPGFLYIYDILGRVVYTAQVQPNSMESVIPIRSFRVGTYYLRMSTAKDVVNMRFEVVR